MNVNKEIFKSAQSFLKMAEIAKKSAIEVCDFRIAFNSNLAFSIELFIKSMDATSEEKVIFEIGTAKITRPFAQSNIKGHKLSSLFEKLPIATQKELDSLFEGHSFNVACQPLKLVLIDIEDSFVLNRYSYEQGGYVSANESHLLLWTARFFQEALTNSLRKHEMN